MTCTERPSLSPVDGVVLGKRVTNERVLAAGEVLLEIGEPDRLEIAAEILSQDVVRIQVGQEVDIEGGRHRGPASEGYRGAHLSARFREDLIARR